MIALAKQLLVAKTRDPRVQLLRYLFVGGSAAAVDLASYALLTEYFGVGIYLSALLAYTVGFLWNHTISVLWIFESKHSRRKEVALAYSIALGGLLWTEALLYVFVALGGIHSLLAKMLTQVIVLGWNFGMRKKFVFH